MSFFYNFENAKKNSFVQTLNYSIMTKKILLLFIVLLSANRAMTQEKHFKEVLTSKTWKVDVEAMKPSLLIKIGSVPEMAKLSSEEKEIVIKSLLSTFEKMKYSFFDDFTQQLSIGEKITSGKYTISENQEQLTLTYDNKNESFSVLKFEEIKIFLKNNKTGTDLILTTIN